MAISKQRLYSILKSLDIKLPRRTLKVLGKKRNLAKPVTQSHTKVILMSPCSHNQLVKAIRSDATAYFATEVAIEQVNQLTHAGDSIKPYDCYTPQARC